MYYIQYFSAGPLSHELVPAKGAQCVLIVKAADGFDSWHKQARDYAETLTDKINTKAYQIWRGDSVQRAYPVSHIIKLPSGQELD